MRRTIVAGLTGLWLVVGALPAGADEDQTGGTVLGIGFGPAARIGGELAPAFEGTGASMRTRLGMRAGQVGAELSVNVTSVEDVRSADEVGEYTSRRGAITALTPTLTYYALAKPPVQVMGRVGLGYAILEGFEKKMSVPCTLAEECVTRDELVDVGYRGYALDLGIMAQVHLARRSSKHRAILWIDLGVALSRMQIDDEVLGGRATQLTIGIAHGIVD